MLNITNTSDDRPNAQIAPRGPVSSVDGSSAFPRELLAQLKPLTRFIAARAQLFRQGENSKFVHLLLSGWAYRYQTLEDGRRQIIDFALPGAILGVSPSPSMSHGCELLTACKIATLTREQFLEGVSRSPKLAEVLITSLSQSEATAFHHLTTVGRRYARERIAALIYELSFRAKQKGMSNWATLPLKQVHIADALGLTTEHVCRTVRELREDGLIHTANGAISVEDLTGLGEEALMDVGEAGLWWSAPGTRSAAPSALHLAQ